MEVRNYISESKGETDWRGCLMLSMPSDVTRMITAWSENNISDDDLAGDGREKYCHCTVLYGFPQSTKFEEVEAEAMDGLDHSTLIDIVLGPIKRFPASENRPESDVLVIEVKGAGQLAPLHERLKTKFNVKTNFPTYNPHVTIAYVKPGSLTELDGTTVFDDYEAHCKAMTYSTGPSDNRNRRTVTFEEFSTETRGR
jgi:2'-5' RNA ligase